MRKTWNPAITAGIALGILYMFEAVFATGILFAVWAILGGIFAAALTKWDPAMALTPGTGARAGARAGLVGGLVLLVVGTPITYFLLRELGEEPGLFGTTLGLPKLATLLLLFLAYAAFGTAVAAAAGGLTGLLGGNKAGQGERR